MDNSYFKDKIKLINEIHKELIWPYSSVNLRTVLVPVTRMATKLMVRMHSYAEQAWDWLKLINN